MEQQLIRDLITTYQELQSLRDKIVLKQAKIHSSPVIKMFGLTIQIAITKQKHALPSQTIRLKQVKYSHVTRDLDIAIKRILIILDCYKETSALPSSLEEEIFLFKQIIVNTRILLVKKAKSKTLSNHVTHLEKMYASSV